MPLSTMEKNRREASREFVKARMDELQVSPRDLFEKMYDESERTQSKLQTIYNIRSNNEHANVSTDMAQRMSGPLQTTVGAILTAGGIHPWSMNGDESVVGGERSDAHPLTVGLLKQLMAARGLMTPEDFVGALEVGDDAFGFQSALAQALTEPDETPINPDQAGRICEVCAEQLEQLGFKPEAPAGRRTAAPIVEETVGDPQPRRRGRQKGTGTGRRPRPAPEPEAAQPRRKPKRTYQRRAARVQEPARTPSVRTAEVRGETMLRVTVRNMDTLEENERIVLQYRGKTYCEMVPEALDDLFRFAD